eukprot:3433629-Lingulodinium_polyedra.AAC.1
MPGPSSLLFAQERPSGACLTQGSSNMFTPAPREAHGRQWPWAWQRWEQNAPPMVPAVANGTRTHG